MNNRWSLPYLSTRLPAKALLFANIGIIAVAVGVFSILGNEYHCLQTEAAQIPDDNRKSATPEPCHIAPSELGRDAIHIMHVEALSTHPTDGTYFDDGYGQGEFETVRLLEVLKSPIHWKSGYVFRVHPFPGRHTEQDNFSPEHLSVGKRYYIVYTYYLDKELMKKSDLLGLTRCGVLEDTPAVRAQLLYGAGNAQHHVSTNR